MTTNLPRRDVLGHWLPGVSPNPTGRPPLKVSLVKMLQDRLTSEPNTAMSIVTAWIEAAKSRDMRAITEILDRLEGKPVEKHLNIGIIAHISEEYTAQILRAMTESELERENRLLLTEGEEEF